MTRLAILALALVLSTSAQAQQPEWMHNGSIMGVDGPQRTVFYVEPRPDIAAFVPPGAILFEGDADNVSGTAYGFWPGCPPSPYRVRLIRPRPDTIILEGPAPVIDALSCTVLELTWNIPAARLLFVKVNGEKR